MPEDKPF